MAVSFTVAQSAITPSQFTVTDTSTSLDPSIVVRHITVTDAFGNPLTGNGTVNYDVWLLADLSITFSFLTEDIGADILVEWLNISDGIVDELDDTYPLSEIGKQFFYYLLQLQGLKPGVVMDTNYLTNLANYWMNILGGDHAVTYGNDIASAQNCYSRETYMRLHQQIYF